MVHLNNILHFPTMKLFPLRGKTTIYKLDWSKVDENKYKEWQSRANTSDQKYPGTLPEKYDSWIQEMLFSLPEDYITTIRECSRKALEEWGKHKNKFDTVIRETLLEPSISYIYVAFRMLADCIYDPTTDYYYRGEDKKIAAQAMLYKFWNGQTGKGRVKDHSFFNKINRELLLELSCSCGDKLWIETTSKGWEMDIRDLDVTCSCGKKVIETTKSSTVVEPTPKCVNEFLQEINKFEQKEKPLKLSCGPIISQNSNTFYYNFPSKAEFIFNEDSSVTISTGNSSTENNSKIIYTVPVDMIPDYMPQHDLWESEKSLFHQWRHGYERNIDCGEVRRIGKTFLLKKMISEYLIKVPENTYIAVLTPTLDLGKHSYGNIKGITIVTPKTIESKLKAIPNVMLFSDEVKDADKMVEGWPNVRYVAGFYNSYKKND